MNKDAVINIIKLNRFSMSLMLTLALPAAALTALFAVGKGVSSLWAIVGRSLFSFLLFAIVGFLTAHFLWVEYSRIITPDEGDAGDGAVAPDVPDTFAAGDAFDKVVIMNNSEEQK